MKLKLYKTILACLFLLSNFCFAQNPGQVVIKNNNPVVPALTDKINLPAVARDEVMMQHQVNLKATAGNESRLSIDKTIQVNVTTGVVNYTNTFPPIDYNRPVGAISGSGNVTPSGQAAYTIPIALPPGIKGMVPSLGISYNSGSPDGLLGRGWNIQGISAISRVPKDFYHDGAKKGIQLDPSDVYALDGVRIIGDRLANDNFSKITLSGDLFIVETKDGMIMEYGKNTDSKLSVNSVTLTWYLSETRDKYGNYISYSYDNNTTNKEVVIKEIKYTGNTAAGISPYNSVKFYYDIRQDKKERYILGHRLKSTLILREVQVDCESKFMKGYKFSYGYNDFYLQSFLNSVTEQGSDYTKLNTTHIKYGDGTAPIASPTGITVTNTGSGTNLPAYAEYRSGDFNGDGKSDLVAFEYNSINGMNGEKNYTTCKLFINTGLSGQATDYNRTTKFNKVSSEIDMTDLIPYAYSDYMSDYAASPYGLQSADFNGDGKDDLLFASTYSGGGFTYRPYFADFSGQGFIEQPTFLVSGNHSFTLADVNGDGRYEAVSLVGSSLTVKFLTTAGSQSGNTPGTYSGLAAIDYDGDGKQDLVTTKSTTNGPRMAVLKITAEPGSGVVVEEKFVENHFPQNYNQRFFGDFNGDGITDNIKIRGIGTYPNNNDPNAEDKVKIRYGTGTGYAKLDGTPADSYDQMDNVAYGYPYYSQRKYMVADINNDGKSDLVSFKFSPCTSSSIQIFGMLGGTTENVPLSTSIIGCAPPVFDYSKIDDAGNASIASGYQEDPNVPCQGWPITVTQCGVNSKVCVTTPNPYNPKFPSLNNAHFIPEFVTGDFNGDGKQDIFFKGCGYSTTGNYSIIYFDKGNTINQPTAFSTQQFVTTIYDGFGLKTKFKYSTLANPDPDNIAYTRGYYSGGYPVIDFQQPLYVASEFSIPDGISPTGENKTSYHYESAHLHLRGKGFLGFDKITATNPASKTQVISEYALKTAFYEKVPLKTETYLTAPPQPLLIAEELYTTVFKSTGLVHFTGIDKTESINHITGGKITVDPTYDVNGNITASTTSVGSITNPTSVETTVTSIPLYVTAGSWLPNAPDEITTTITRTEDASNPYVKKVKYAYDLTKGAITKTSLDLHAINNKNVITDYEYFTGTGVLKKETVSSTENDLPYALPTKTVEYIYDLPLQRFATQTKNPLNQSSYATYDPKWGKPLTETDISGLTTTYQYDGYGRTIKVTTPDNLTTNTSFAWATSASPNPVVQTDYDRTTFASSIVTNALYSVTNQRSGSPTSKTIYDIYGRELAAETDGFAGKLYAANKYNVRGNIEKTSGAYQNGVTMAPVITTNTYDDLNRISSTHSTSANLSVSPSSTLFAYSAPAGDGSSIVGTTTPDSKVFSKTTDASGLLKSSTDAGGNILYSYYSNRQLKQTTVGGLVTNTMEYDELARQTKLTEANSGVTEYKYNAYGELFYQKDARGNETGFEYNDVLGRMTLKKCTTAVTGAIDTYTFNYVLSGNGLNAIQSTSGPGNISYSYTYDNLHRVTKVDENINGPLFSTSYEYDAFGNITKQTYPSGFSVKHGYNANGYHMQAKRGDNGVLIYQADEMNALGQYNKYTLGNIVQTQKTFNDRGMPSTCIATGIQNMEYGFNFINGNLNYRKDFIVNHTENFEYDNLDRLTNIYRDGPLVHNTTYTSAGNINTKSDAGTGAYLYTAPGPKPHVVSRINNPTIYISENPQTISYTPFQKAKTITENLYTLDFMYGPDYERKKTELRFQNNLRSTRYFTGDYEKTISGSTTEEVHYINSGGGLVGMYVITNGTGTMYYPYTDHLGSILKVTNGSGGIVAQQNFDAWGNYRNPSTWQLLPPIGEGSGVAWLYRGFTGHEHHNDFALINMNGRMYDPIVGRMLSPDVMLQAPDYSQSHNRYSYVFNNPLKFTDPSGMEGRGYDWMNEAFEGEYAADRAFSRAMRAEGFKQRGDTWGRYETVNHKGGVYKDQLYNAVIEKPSSTTIFTPVANAVNIETGFRMANRMRGDVGNTFFTNETKAYNFMWSNSVKDKAEYAGLLTSGGVIAFKSGQGGGPAFGGLSPIKIGNKTFVKYNGKNTEVLGQIHTHWSPDPSGHPTLSWVSGNDDVQTAKYLTGKPVFAITFENTIEAGYWPAGADTWHDFKMQYGNKIATRDDLLKGKVLLLPTLRNWKK